MRAGGARNSAASYVHELQVSGQRRSSTYPDAGLEPAVIGIGRDARGLALRHWQLFGHPDWDRHADAGHIAVFDEEHRVLIRAVPAGETEPEPRVEDRPVAHTH